MGDRLLKMVAERLKSEVRGDNLVARLGGDEFAIVLAADVSPNEASDYAARLIRTLSARYDMDGIEVVIGASIGIALSPGDGDTSEELMRNADMALYRAKSDGGGVHRFFEREMDRQAQRRRDMELDLRRAFANGEFEVHYQPLVDIAADRISGFESLLRWRTRKGHDLAGGLRPVAEDIGLIVALGEWVLREACTEAAKWPADVKVAVNLSPVQFRSRNLVQVVISALAHSGLSPLRLELEITESLFLAETEADLAILHQLRELGVSISMDDFGTGYSSLSYLRSFPFDKIKIDRSFIKDLASAPTVLRSCGRSPASAAASTSPRRPKAWRPSTSSTGCGPKAATRCRASCSARRGPPPRSRRCCLFWRAGLEGGVKASIPLGRGRFWAFLVRKSRLRTI